MSCVLANGALGNQAWQANQVEPQSKETQSRLKEVELRRRELKERLYQARHKEQLALLQLHKLQTKLDVATGALKDSRHKLKRTESKIDECQRTLSQTTISEMALSKQAVRRLREIYEGQRLNLLEMLLQVDSLQGLLDLFYYQERVAEMDKKLIDELRVQAKELARRKDKLGEQKNKLGDLVYEFAQRALMISKEKLNQQQIAERLRTQRAFYEQAERQLALESQRLEQQIMAMESSSKQSKKDMAIGSGNMCIPIQAQITSPFGWRRHPIFGVRRFHTGIDLAAPNHSPIKAADSGNILYTGWYGGYGKVVIVSHGKGKATLYAHLSKIAVLAGKNVTKGDIIGYEGTTGFSTGPHLHFEVRVNGKPNNPLDFVQ